MHVALLVLIVAGSVSADWPGVRAALELLQVRLENDLKFAEVHALQDLDNIVQDTQKGIAAIVKNPTKGTKELILSLTKDIKQSIVWTREDSREIKSHLKEAIEVSSQYRLQNVIL